MTYGFVHVSSSDPSRVRWRFAMSLCFMNSMKRTVLVAIYPLHSLILIHQVIPAHFVFLHNGSRLLSHVIYHSRKYISKFTHTYTNMEQESKQEEISRSKQQIIYSRPPHLQDQNLEGCKTKNKHGIARDEIGPIGV
ncbi:hypothetical protein BDV40DRAFT_250764 [Aspergillus tamarii]|uniref:Uncharacterized protein n=1 Tax=Aspergillus tamarii TaxID=41984 RepID=A0A5N6UKI0_ASPTM|nr:hypothetical protein BDV40DRAFT_250764 [Aspergillus tamarii]